MRKSSLGALLNQPCSFPRPLQRPGLIIYLVLAGLCCDPLHQKRGAGTLLVEWGCAEADSLGLRAYVEASPLGLPLYLKFGFKEIEKVQFDLSKYGRPERNDVTVIMGRERKLRE